MARLRNALLAGLVFAFLLREGSPPVLAQSSSAGSPHIGFEVPAVVDPIHANGQPEDLPGGLLWYTGRRLLMARGARPTPWPDAPVGHHRRIASPLQRLHA